jgi:hypothetical protein
MRYTALTKNVKYIPVRKPQQKIPPGIYKYRQDDIKKIPYRNRVR